MRATKTTETLYTLTVNKRAAEVLKALLCRGGYWYGPGDFGASMRMMFNEIDLEWDDITDTGEYPHDAHTGEKLSLPNWKKVR